jgi:hypothetical protein
MKVYLIHIIHLLFGSLLLLACKNVGIKNGEDIQISRNITQAIVVPSNEARIQIDSSVSLLPFHSGEVNREYAKPLPKIDSVIYHKLNTRFDANFNRDQRLKELKTYNNELPKLGEYDVYYTEFNCDLEHENALNEICDGFASLMCGFLVFYDSETKIADFVNIRNSYYNDAGIDLSFIIKNNYEIRLDETEMTDAEDGESIETYFSDHYYIILDKNNTLKVQHQAKE